MAQIDVSGSGDICFDEWIASLLDWRKVGVWLPGRLWGV